MLGISTFKKISCVHFFKIKTVAFANAKSSYPKESEGLLVYHRTYNDDIENILGQGLIL